MGSKFNTLLHLGNLWGTVFSTVNSLKPVTFKVFLIQNYIKI